VPNCFQLFNKSTGEATSLVDVDNRMCAYFKVTPDATYFYKSWYDVIGFALAMGKNFAEIRDKFPRHAEITDWLEANYTPSAWYEPK
jgi:hypothetical protein